MIRGSRWAECYPACGFQFISWKETLRRLAVPIYPEEQG
jgi:hypothetical protein